MNGKITELEIEKVAKERREYEKENDPITLKILGGLRVGKNHKEIAEDVMLSSTGVLKRKNKLIEER